MKKKIVRTRAAVQASCEKHTARSGVCPQRRPHAQQQLARDLEVERAVMFSMFSMLLLLLLAAAAAAVVRCRGPTLWCDEWGTHPG